MFQIIRVWFCYSNIFRVSFTSNCIISKRINKYNRTGTPIKVCLINHHLNFITSVYVFFDPRKPCRHPIRFRRKLHHVTLCYAGGTHNNVTCTHYKPIGISDNQ